MRAKTMILMFAVLVCGACIVGIGAMYRASYEQRAYDNRLTNLGIGPSVESVEEYIIKAIQLGASKGDILNQLAPLGVVGHSGVESPDCEIIMIFLSHSPGNRYPFYVPPNTPPVYSINVCYTNGVVSRVDELKRVDGFAR